MRFLLSILLLSLFLVCRSQDRVVIQYGDLKYMDSAFYMDIKYYVIKKDLKNIDLKILNYFNKGGYALVSLREGKLNGEFIEILKENDSIIEKYFNDTLQSRIEKGSSGKLFRSTKFTYIGKDTMSHATIFYENENVEGEYYSLNGRPAFKHTSFYDNGNLRSISYYREGWNKFDTLKRDVVYASDNMSNPLTFDSIYHVFELHKFVYAWHKNKRPAIGYKFITKNQMRQFHYNPDGDVIAYYTYKYGQIELERNYDYNSFGELYVNGPRGTRGIFEGWYLDGESYFELQGKKKVRNFRKGKLITSRIRSS